MYPENEIIPAIIVTDFKQNKLDLLKKYAQKKLLILMYNNQCLGCTGRAIPFAYQLQLENPEIQVVGIHTVFNKQQATETEIKSIFTSGELPFPIYLDEDHSVFDQFESSGTPQWVLITEAGKLYRSLFGSQEAAQNRLFYALEESNENKKTF